MNANSSTRTSHRLTPTSAILTCPHHLIFTIGCRQAHLHHSIPQSRCSQWDSPLHPALRNASNLSLADGCIVHCPFRAKAGAVAHTQLQLYHVRASSIVRADASHPIDVRVRDIKHGYLPAGAVWGPLEDDGKREGVSRME